MFPLDVLREGGGFLPLPWGLQVSPASLCQTSLCKDTQPKATKISPYLHLNDTFTAPQGHLDSSLGGGAIQPLQLVRKQALLGGRGHAPAVIPLATTVSA